MALEGGVQFEPRQSKALEETHGGAVDVDMEHAEREHADDQRQPRQLCPTQTVEMNAKNACEKADTKERQVPGERRE